MSRNDLKDYGKRMRRREVSYIAIAALLGLAYALIGTQQYHEEVALEAERKAMPPALSYPCTWIKHNDEPRQCVDADLSERKWP